jgi:two-component system, NarL family, nitrate/nitrite response regulator NarL
VISVLVCSPVRLYREGLVEILDRDPGVTVIGSAADARETRARASALTPAIVLLDTTLPGALETTRALAGIRPAPRVVAFAMSEDERAIVAYAEAGVAAYVTRDESIADLLVALRSADRGEMRCSPVTAAILLRRVTSLAAERELRAPRRVPPAPVRLTPRELEIVALVDDGLSNKQIAQRLQIELPTVKNHVHHVLEKLQVARRGDVVAALRGQAAPHRAQL